MVITQSLIEEAKQDPDRFGQLYDITVNDVYRFIMYRVRNQTIAEDLTSETYMKVLHYLQDFDPARGQFLNWLYTIAANTIRDYYRKANRECQLEETTELTMGIHDERLEQIEMQDQMLTLIHQLTEDQREVVLFRYYHDLKLKDIAIQMNKSENAVKQLLLRAVNRLKKAWEGREAL